MIFEIAGVTWTVAAFVGAIEVPPAFPNQRFSATAPDRATVHFEVPWPPGLRRFSRRAIQTALAAAIASGDPARGRVTSRGRAPTTTRPGA